MKQRPHPGFDRLCAAALRLLPVAAGWAGTAYRTVGPKYSRPDEIISGVGAKLGGGRWNPVGAFNAVYAATTPETATAETFAHNRHYGIPDYEALPRVMVALDARPGRVLDLTAAPVRRAMGLSVTRLLGEDWRREQDRGRAALTQAAGRAGFEAGFDGLLVPSHAARGGVNLVILPERLGPAALVEVRNPDDLLALRRP